MKSSRQVGGCGRKTPAGYDNRASGLLPSAPMLDRSFQAAALARNFDADVETPYKRYASRWTTASCVRLSLILEERKCRC
jgi:hypothetical protein